MENTMKKLLVNGCSFSRGPDSWPYYLSDLCNFDLVNLAQSGAGNTYIQESTIEELAQRNYDYVIVMWTGLARIDFKVHDITLFKDSAYTSGYQKTRNDWAEKNIHPVNDQDYVSDNWAFSCGHVNLEQAMTESSLFTGIYRHLHSKEFAYHALQKMIALQSFLKAQNINYLFTFYQDYVNELAQQEDLYKLLDQNNMFIEKNIYNIACSNNDTDQTNHPGKITHKQWAELLKLRING